MRSYYDDFKIDGRPVLVPDENVEISQNDLDAEDTGRDESGVMHRIVLRERIKTFGFNYGHLTAEEYRYMESLFAGKPEFIFSYRGIDGNVAECVAYCSNNSITLRNAKTGDYRNYKFNIIEC